MLGCPCPCLQAPFGQACSGLGSSTNHSKYKPELPWEMCWGPPPGQRLPSHTAQPFSHALQLHLLAAHACGQPDIHFSCSTAGEPDLEGEDVRPRPHRLGPSFTTAGRWRAAAGDSGSWVPHAFGPEGCQAPSAPVPSTWPASGCPELAFPNPVWKMLFI